MLWNFQYRDSSGHPRRRRLKLNLCFNWRVCSPFTSYTLLHWNTSTLIWWNLYKWVLFSPCLSTLTPSDRDQFLSPLRPLICAISIRCCFHLLTKSNFTSAHSLTDQIKGAQEWVYLMGGNTCTNHLSYSSAEDIAGDYGVIISDSRGSVINGKEFRGLR